MKQRQFITETTRTEISEEQQNLFLENVTTNLINTLSEFIETDALQLFTLEHSIDEQTGILSCTVTLTEQGKSILFKAGAITHAQARISELEPKTTGDIVFKGIHTSYSTTEKKQISGRKTEKEQRLKEAKGKKGYVSREEQEEIRTLQAEIAQLNGILGKFRGRAQMKKDLADLQASLTKLQEPRNDTNKDNTKLRREVQKAGDDYIKTILQQLNEVTSSQTLEKSVIEKHTILNPEWAKEKQAKEAAEKFEFLKKSLTIRITVALGITVVAGLGLKALYQKDSPTDPQSAESVEPKPTSDETRVRKYSGDIPMISPEREKERAHNSTFDFINDTIVQNKSDASQKTKEFIAMYKSLYPNIALNMPEKTILNTLISQNVMREIQNGNTENSQFLKNLQSTIIRQNSNLIKSQGLTTRTEDQLLIEIGNAIKFLQLEEKEANQLGQTWAAETFHKILESVNMYVGNKKFPQIQFEGNNMKFIRR